MKTSTFVLALLLPLAARAARADDVTPHDWNAMRPRSANVIHLELVTGVVTNALTINYEREFQPLLSLRVGYAASAVVGGEDDSTRSAHGPLAMLTLLLGDDAKFEVGAGVSVVTSQQPMRVGLDLGAGWHIVPNFVLGFRYQSPGGGPVFRAGFAWMSAYGAPLSLGFGWAF